MEETIKNYQNAASCPKKASGEDGFTLVEAIIAIIILTIALLGVMTLFAYATKRNTGNNTRSQALAALQQRIELIRSYKFTPSTTDPKLSGGTKAAELVTSADGGTYQVQVIVDDDPNTNGVQIDSTSTLKEITVTVTGPLTGEKWVTALPTTVVTRRVRAN